MVNVYSSGAVADFIEAPDDRGGGTEDETEPVITSCPANHD